MMDFLRPALEFSILIPGIVLCLLPMKGKTRIPEPQIFFAAAAYTAILCLICGSICYVMNWPTIYLQLPILFAIGIGYCKCIRLDHLRLISILLSMCGMFSCMMGPASASELKLFGAASTPWLGFTGALIYNALGWIYTFAAWYPARHSVPILLEDDIVDTWYPFWILPAVVIIINTYLTPQPSQINTTGDIMRGYVLRSSMMIGLMAMLYYAFFRLGKGVITNNRLQCENEFLHMQSAQYDALRSVISETRQARHDMRHHFNALSAMIKKGEWNEAEEYLKQAQESIPSDELSLCSNSAVNAVACHYSTLCRRQEIPVVFKLAFPLKLPVSEMEVCVVLSNLLENAMEASLRTDISRRRIDVNGRIHGDKLVLLSVENAYDDKIIVKDEVFQSTKRSGEGIGLQSIQRVAKSNNGYCNFSYSDGIFRAHIMLRGE